MKMQMVIELLSVLKKKRQDDMAGRHLMVIL